MATTDRPAGARNTDYAQALALAGLLAGASLSLGRVYEGMDWWLPTWLTMGSALGLAALLRRFGAGQVLSLVGMAVGFVVVAGLLLFPETLLVVVPTAATLSEMYRAAQVALDGVVQQAAPVDVTREFLLLTSAGAWAVATSADGLAFRARQPLLALVPALGLFVFPAVIRPLSPAWYTLWFLAGAAGLLLYEGRARLVTWGQWVSSPAGRPSAGWRLPVTPAVSTGRWLAIGAGLVALVAPWLLPGYGQPPLLDYHTGASPDAPIAINPFVSLRANLDSRVNAELFTVETNQPSYWRLLVADRFDGTTWRPSDLGDDAPELASGAVADFLSNAPVKQVQQRFEIKQLGGRWLPAAASPVSVAVGGRFERRRTVYQNRVNHGLTLRRPLRDGLSYTAVSAVLEARAEHLKAASQGGGGQDPGARYLNAGAVTPAVEELTESVVEGKRTPYERALAIQDYLRSSAFSYDLNVPQLAAGGNQLERFLKEVKTGYCEQFAGAMAAMARVADIPARVAIGFTRGVPDQEGRYVVSQDDAHAWPELWFSGVGWVPFEPTPRGDGQALQPVYTLDRGTAPPTGAAGQPGSDTTLPEAAPGRDPQLDVDPGAVEEPAGEERPGLLARREVQIALGLLVLALLVPVGKAGRTLVARGRASHQPRDVVAEAYTEVTDWATDAGIGRRPAETPAAYARRMAAAYEEAAGPLVELTGLYVGAEYASGAPGAEQAHRSKRLARAARSRLGRELGWGRRVAAAFSPRSLLRPRALARR